MDFRGTGAKEGADRNVVERATGADVGTDLFGWLVRNGIEGAVGTAEGAFRAALLLPPQLHILLHRTDDFFCS